MNLKDFAPSRWAAGPAIILVVVLVAGACGTRLSPETQGQVSMAPTMPAAVDAAATISANLRMPLAWNGACGHIFVTLGSCRPRLQAHLKSLPTKDAPLLRAAHGYADPASNPRTYPNAYSAA